MTTTLLTGKLDRLRRIVTDMESVLVAFSGGIDSTLVLKIAHDELGPKAVGITAVSPTYPAAELESAARAAQEIGAQHEVVSTDQLAIPAFVQNDSARCFHCKTDLYRLMEGLRAARSMQPRKPASTTCRVRCRSSGHARASRSTSWRRASRKPTRGR